MPHLFTPLTLRGLTIRNRIAMSPMCMYSAAADGLATDWHLGHYQARAAGGAGLVITEATAIEARGRISRSDLGLWNDKQIGPLARIVRSAQAEGAAVAVQLAHAGRKAWSSSKGYGPEPVVAPSPLAFDEGWRIPIELDGEEIQTLVSAWQAAARRAGDAGFDIVEIHGAHGYLNHQFLSPLSNQRTDSYGGTLPNRMRLLLQVAEAVREVWPEDKPLFVRVSATDWVDGGLTLAEIVSVARELGRLGVDLIDCSAGGSVPTGPSEVGPGYQVRFAAKVKTEAKIASGAVGLITAPELADEIVRNERADLVLLGREFLRHPYWPLDAARILGQDIDWPRQYRRGKLA